MIINVLGLISASSIVIRDAARMLSVRVAKSVLTMIMIRPSTKEVINVQSSQLQVLILTVLSRNIVKTMDSFIVIWQVRVHFPIENVRQKRLIH